MFDSTKIEDVGAVDQRDASKRPFREASRTDQQGAILSEMSADVSLGAAVVILREVCIAPPNSLCHVR